MEWLTCRELRLRLRPCHWIKNRRLVMSLRISALIARNSDRMCPKSTLLITGASKEDISHRKQLQTLGDLCKSSSISSTLFSCLCWPCRRRPCRSPSFLPTSHSDRTCLATSISVDGKWSTYNFTKVSCIMTSILLKR